LVTHPESTLTTVSASITRRITATLFVAQGLALAALIASLGFATLSTLGAALALVLGAASLRKPQAQPATLLNRAQ